MSLRRRLAAVAAAAVAAAVIAVALSAWFATRTVLRGQVDEALREQAARTTLIQAAPGLQPSAGLPGAPTDAPRYFTLLLDRARQAAVPGVQRIEESLPEEARELQPGDPPVFFDATLREKPVRFLAEASVDGDVLVIARPTDDMQAALRTLGVVLALLAATGVAVAFIGGRAAARAALAPVDRLAEAAQSIASTRDLTRRIDPGGDAELRRLADAFNTMLAALERSDQSQRRLVADASHELRTPLTSLRLNLELLADERALAPEDRDRLRRDLVVQLDELTALVGDLVEVARDDQADAGEPEDLDLAEVVGSALSRAQARHPGVRFDAELDPTPVRGQHDRLERAVANLLENAVRHGSPERPVEVRLAGRRLTVRDRGPGIADADLPHVFERFYRAPGARRLPGSGLGLAIVRGAVEAHGGRVWAEHAPGGGALLKADFSASP